MYKFTYSHRHFKMIIIKDSFKSLCGVSIKTILDKWILSAEIAGTDSIIISP